MKSTPAGKYQFATFALDRMKLSTVHRRKKSKWIGNTKGIGTRRYHRPHSRRRAYCTVVW